MVEWRKWLGGGDRLQSQEQVAIGTLEFTANTGSQCPLYAMYKGSTPSQIHTQDSQLTPGMAQSQIISCI